jgi:hypothetical protein
MRYTQQDIEDAQEPSFEAPIPGMSLTTEPGSRPWEQPPQYTTVMETADHYIENLFSPDGIDLIVAASEMGSSALDIAEKLTMSGASRGVHSVDVGVTVSPILVEVIKTVANFTDVELPIGDEDDSNRFSDSMAELMKKRMSDEAETDDVSLSFDLEDFDMSDMPEEDEDEEDMDVDMPEEQESEMASGLMSRRV